MPREADTSAGAGLFEQSQRGAPAEAGTAQAGGERLPISLHGYTRGDIFVGKALGSNAAEVKAAYAELGLRLELDNPGYGGAFSEVRLRSAVDAGSSGSVVELREAYVNAYLGPLDLRIGQQIIVWGRADAFNPTNNLTPIDLRVRSPIEDDRRLANLALRAWLTLAPLRIEAVAVPLYAASELPPIEPPEFVTLSEPNFPNAELSNGLLALRVHLELPDLEASASYLHGYAPLPGLGLRDFTVGEDPPEIRVARTAYVQHVAGVDFSTAVGDLFALRGEAAYRHPVNYEATVHAPRPDLQYVLGVDRAFGSLNLILQYVGRYTFDWRLETGPENPVDPIALVDFTEPLPLLLDQTITASIEGELSMRNQILFVQRARVQHLLSLRAEWLTLRDTLSLSALTLVNLTTEEWLLYPKLSYRISDWMSTALGAELYAGPDGSLFGLIDERLSAGYAELRMSF